MALSWARNAPTELAWSRSLVRSCNRARNSVPARRPFGVLVKKRNCLGSWRVSSPSGGVEVGDAGHLVDAFAPGRASSGEDHLAHQLRLLLGDDLGDHAAHGEPEQVDLIQAEGTDEA